MIEPLVLNPTARDVIDTVNELIEEVNTGGGGGGGGGGGSSTFIGLTDVPASFSGNALKKLRVNAPANAIEFVEDTGILTSGSFVLNVPSQYATFSLALAAAKVRAYSGTVTINFETGFVLTEPLWFDSVNMPNLEITAASAISVDATSFPALVAGVYTTVFGGNNSRIGRVSGTFNVTTGDSLSLLAAYGSNFSFTAGRNNYLGSTQSFSLSGMSGGGGFVNTNIIGEGQFVINPVAPSSVEFTGGNISSLDFSFGGEFIRIGSIPAFSLAISNNVNFKKLTLTGASCRIETIGGNVDLGLIEPNPGAPLSITAQLSSNVIGRMESGASFASTNTTPTFYAQASSIKITIAGNATWKPLGVSSSISSAIANGRVDLHIVGTLTIDNSITTADYITRVGTVSEVSLFTDGIVGTYNNISNVPVNAVAPTNSPSNTAGCICRFYGTSIGTENVWTAPTLLNGWTNIVGWQAAQYRKVGDMVEIRMSVENGTAAGLFNLPVGFRPPANISFSCNVHDNANAPEYGHLVIESDGDVFLEHPGTPSSHKVYAVVQFSVLS